MFTSGFAYQSLIEKHKILGATRKTSSLSSEFLEMPINCVAPGCLSEQEKDNDANGRPLSFHR